MFCSECGNNLPQDSRFCTSCGASTVDDSSRSDSGKRPAQKKKTTTSNISKDYFHKGGVIGVVAILALLVFLEYRIARHAEFSAEMSAKSAEQARADSDQAKQQALKEIADEKSQVQAVLANGNKTTITDIVKKWSPIIAYVYCQYTDGYGQSQAQSGSGTLLIKNDGSRSILTNYHVVSDRNGYIVDECSVKLPEDDTAYTAYHNYREITTTPDTADVAYIAIDTPDSYLQNLTTEGRNYCSKVPNVGDEIVVLGYPGIGSDSGVTATDGIISSYDGNYYVTSAKVAHGNSGGAAIDVARNCYLGIPTYVETDSAESLARILKWQAF